MVDGVWQLAKQSLILDARLLRTHLIRLGLGLGLLFFIALFQQGAASSAFGRDIFQCQVMLTMIYLSLEAVFTFSRVLSEEREQGSLELLRLAGFSSAAVVMGRSAGRFADAGLMILIQFPFTLLCVTLGGLTWSQVVAAGVLLCSFLWFLCGVSLAISVWTPSGRRAMAWMAGIVGISVLLPLLIQLLGAWRGLGSVSPFVLQLISHSLPFQLEEVLSVGFPGNVLDAGGITAFLVGSAAFVLAWLGLARPAAEPSSGRSRLALGNAVPVASLRVHERPWREAVRWREFFYTVGGRRGVICRAFAQLVILVLCLLWINVGHGSIWAATYGGLLALLDGSWTVVRLVRDDIQERTWSSLILTPHPVDDLRRQKWRGWWDGCWPNVVIPYLAVLITMFTNPYSSGHPLLALALAVATIGMGVAILAYLHVVSLWSLSLGWGAVPLALTVFVLSVVLYFWLVFDLFRSRDLGMALWAIAISLILLAVIAALRRRLDARLLHLAAED